MGILPGYSAGRPSHQSLDSRRLVDYPEILGTVFARFGPVTSYGTIFARYAENGWDIPPQMHLNVLNCRYCG